MLVAYRMYVHVYIGMYIWSSYVAEYGSTGCQSCSWSAEKEKLMFPCPRARLRFWSRETGSAVPSHVSLLILHTQAGSAAYSRDSSRFPRRRPFIYFHRHTPSGQSLVYWVTHVHCRGSAGAWPVGHHGPINVRSLFSRAHFWSTL